MNDLAKEKTTNMIRKHATINFNNTLEQNLFIESLSK
jgi:hypothetical protein